MELAINSNTASMVQNKEQIVQQENSKFIGGNTKKVNLNHLKNECIIPVFSKDNETTISHYQFINQAQESVQEVFSDFQISEPTIRVSHMIKGRTPSAIGKPVKELEDSEKTIYYERCAFLIEIKERSVRVGNNKLTFCVGGVRAYNQENLYSKKSPEKFKVFVGFKNVVCTNLCVSTDGFSNEIKVSSLVGLKESISNLLNAYDSENHLNGLKYLPEVLVKENQFAHFVGRVRMFQHIDRNEKKKIYPFLLNDGQISSVVKGYYNCPNFGRNSDGSISLWNLYNLMTEANKSSYIDNNIERNVNAYGLMQNLRESMNSEQGNWYLPTLLYSVLIFIVMFPELFY
ncbi:MAG: hypothetical protein CMC13_11300 [Flavobacteriaceae bacterium]|nr:hypothetical protein [Flavobacteriaceae bacterium]|tara:strand:- start:10087 stop:11121 length:1035 start_codon:yes stop_codon:yes gene_type:complete